VLGLMVEQAREVVEHLVVPGQDVGSVGGEAGLDLGGHGGVDGDHFFSAIEGC
jgi:hypothetical protein